MQNSQVYREVKPWKKPVHVTRSFIAKSYMRLLPTTEVIGITGSVAKTLTQNAIYSVLSQKFNVLAPDENLDPTFRIPKTILATKPWHRKMIIEYGIEHPGDMDHYLSIVKPKIAVVTLIAPSHIKYLNSLEGVFKEKVELVKALPKDGHAVLNADDPLAASMAQYTKAKVHLFGESAEDGVKISHFSQNLRGSKFRLHYNGQIATVSWKVIGRHQLLAAYAAATVGIISHLTLKQIAKGLSVTKVPKHRLNLIMTKKAKIIDDTYNNVTPRGAIESVNTLIDLGTGYQKIAVFGEMKDLGELSDNAHQNLGKVIAKSNIKYLINVGRVARDIGLSARKNHFRGKIIDVASSRDAINQIKRIMTKKHLILIKGSRHTHLERVVKGLLGHTTRIHCYHCGVLN